MIPVHSRALPSGAKKNDKIVSDYFAVLAITLPLIWLKFCLDWKIDTTSPVNVAVYFAQILKNFARIMASFSALGCDRIPCIPMLYAYASA